MTWLASFWSSPWSLVALLGAFFAALGVYAAAKKEAGKSFWSFIRSWSFVSFLGAVFAAAGVYGAAQEDAAKSDQLVVAQKDLLAAQKAQRLKSDEIAALATENTELAKEIARLSKEHTFLVKDQAQN